MEKKNVKHRWLKCLYKLHNLACLFQVMLEDLSQSAVPRHINRSNRCSAMVHWAAWTCCASVNFQHVPIGLYLESYPNISQLYPNMIHYDSVLLILDDFRIISGPHESPRITCSQALMTLFTRITSTPQGAASASPKRWQAIRQWPRPNQHQAADAPRIQFFETLKVMRCIKERDSNRKDIFHILSININHYSLTCLWVRWCNDVSNPRFEGSGDFDGTQPTRKFDRPSKLPPTALINVVYDTTSLAPQLGFA